MKEPVKYQVCYPIRGAWLVKKCIWCGKSHIHEGGDLFSLCKIRSPCGYYYHLTQMPDFSGMPTRKRKMSAEGTERKVPRTSRKWNFSRSLVLTEKQKQILEDLDQSSDIWVESRSDLRELLGVSGAFLGGSSMTGIIGLSKYPSSSPEMLFYLYTGRVHRTIDTISKARMKRGHEKEDVMTRLYEEIMGQKVVTRGIKTVGSNASSFGDRFANLDWIGVSPDGVCYGGRVEG